jgi:hypothetical protein
MAGTPQTNPTKAALEAAVLDLTDEEIVEALLRRPLMDEITRRNDIKQAFEARRAYAWPTEARRNLLDALARRLERGRVAASG